MSGFLSYMLWAHSGAPDIQLHSVASSGRLPWSFCLSELFTMNVQQFLND